MARNSEETNICVAFINRLQQYHPEIAASIWHCPNESTTRQRNDIGTKPGQPDYCLSVPSGGFGALFIEMKRPGVRGHKNGGLSDAQVLRIEQLRLDGNMVTICYNWQDAVSSCTSYLAQT